MSNKEVGITLKVGKTGFENIDQLGKQLQAAGVDTAELDKRATELNAELQRLAAERGLIDNFARQKTAVGEAGAAMEAARVNAQKLGKEIAATEEPAKKQEAAFTRARTAVKEADQAYQEQRLVLQNLREQLTAVGISSTDLAAAQVKSRSETEAARAGVTALEGQYRTLSTSTTTAAEKAKTLAANLQALQGNLKDSAPAADAMGQHLDTAFRTLGVQSVKQVTAEIDRLKAALYTIKAADAFGPDIERASIAAKTRIQELERELQGVPPAAAKASSGLQGVATASTSTGVSMEAATTRAVAMGAALLGISSAGQAAQSVLGTAAAFETLRTRLDQTLGSQKAATEAFEGIKKLAIETPFEVKDLTDTFIRLTNFGLKPTTSQMLALADTAAIAGGGTEALSRVTLALGQAWAKTKLQGDEILQLTEAGVPVWDLLTKATGKNVVELQKLSEAGALGRDVIIKLFDAIGEKNAGASVKLMATFSGTVSNAKDAMSEFFDLIGRSGALDYLTLKLQEALAEFQELKDSGELERKAKAIADAFIKFAQGVELAFDAVKKLVPVLELLAAAWAADKALDYATKLFGVTKAVEAARLASVEMAATQRVVAAETAAASTAVAGVGAKAATSAIGVGLLGSAMKLLGGLGVGALVLGVGELVGEFFRAKKAAEDGDEAVRKMLAGPPAGGQGAKGAIRDVNAELADFRKNLPKLEGDIAGVTGQGLADVAKKTIENLRAIKAPAEEVQQALLVIAERAAKTLGIELPSQAAKASDGFKAVQAEALTLINQFPKIGLTAEAATGVASKATTALAENAKASGDAIARALAKMVDAAETKKDFELVNAEIKLMANAGRIGPGAVAELLNLVADKAQEVKDKVEAATPGIAGLREAAKKAGVDVGELTTGIGKGFKDSLTDVANMSAEIVKTGVSAERASPILAAALDKQLQAAKTKEEVALVRAEIDKAAKAGTLFGADLTDATVKAKTKAEELSPAFRQAAADAKLLGVELQGATKVSPEDGIRAFERLKASGKATADEVTTAFVNLANQQIKAANGIVPEWVKVEAELRGAVVTIDEAGRAVVKTFEDADKAVKNTANSTGGLKTALDDTASSAKAVGVQLQRNADLFTAQGTAERNAKVASGKAAGSLGASIQNTASGGVTRTEQGPQAVPPDNSGNWIATTDRRLITHQAYDATGRPIAGVGWYEPAAAANARREADVAAQRQTATAAAAALPPAASPVSSDVTVNLNFGGKSYSVATTSQAAADTLIEALTEAAKQAGGG